MAIGYADRDSLLEHEGHRLEVAIYADNSNDNNIADIVSVTIECMDCFEVLIDTEEYDDGPEPDTWYKEFNERD